MKFRLFPFSFPFSATFISFHKFTQSTRVQFIGQIIDALLRRKVLLCNELTGGCSGLGHGTRRSKAGTAVISYGRSRAENGKSVHFERMLVDWFIHLGKGLGQR
jgi:hypothetical protein